MIDDWALDIIRRLNSYTEASPSGTGVRIFIDVSSRSRLPARADRGLFRIAGISPSPAIGSRAPEDD